MQRVIFWINACSIQLTFGELYKKSTIFFLVNNGKVYILDMNLILTCSIIRLYLLPLIYELGIWISMHYYVYLFLKSLSGMVSWFIVVNFSQGSHQCGAARAVHPGPGGQPVHESVCVQESQWKLRKLLLLRSLLEHQISQLCHRAHHQGNNSDAI